MGTEGNSPDEAPKGDDGPLPVAEPMPAQPQVELRAPIKPDAAQGELASRPAQQPTSKLEPIPKPTELLPVPIINDDGLSAFERKTIRYGKLGILVAFLALVAASVTGYFIYGQFAAMEEANELASSVAKKARIDSASASIATAQQIAILQKQLTEQQNALEIGQRANVTIGRPDGTVAEIVWPKDPDGKAGILVYFQNSGHLSAKFNWGSDSRMIVMVPSDPKALTESEMAHTRWFELDTPHYFQPMWAGRWSHDGTYSLAWGEYVNIAGNATYQGVLWEVPKERMQQMMTWDRPFMPSGRFEYCDGFRNRICKNFTLQYAGEPYNRFFLAAEGECPAMEMQVLRPDPKMKYFPPCSTEIPKEFQTLLPNLPKP